MTVGESKLGKQPDPNGECRSQGGDSYLWDITYGANQIDVTAVPTPEPGTFPLLGLGMVGLPLYSGRNWARAFRQKRASL